MSGVVVERQGGLARVTLARPPLNLLTPSLIGDLRAAFEGLARAPEVRVIVLGAAGRAFSGGVEVQAMRDLDPAAGRAFIGALHAAIEVVAAVPAVVLACLHG
ncbi:MAG: enoyl-CoA hydratase/isomerase family protein, partial [Candidatus Rokuibacteriota bacterium]